MARKVTITETNISEETSSETKKKDTPTLISIKQARNICGGYISEINRSAKYNEDNPHAREALFEAVSGILYQERQIGSADDFHNFACLLGGHGFDGLACDILDRGLERFPMNVDLLADYLLYGIDCERWEQCKIHSQTLDSIPKDDWTWRGFVFGIGYTKKLRDNFATTNELRKAFKKRISDLSRAYKKYLPYEEGGYRETALLQSKDPNATLRLLNEALMSDTLGACATCAFEKAQILFKQKRYKEALEAIGRSLEDSINETQGGLKEYYLYFLSGLCKYAILFKKIKDKSDIFTDEVLDIYSDFDKSLSDLGDNEKEKIQIRTKNLIKSTKFQVTDDFEDLYALME